jgi:hypothetical protein
LIKNNLKYKKLILIKVKMLIEYKIINKCPLEYVQADNLNPKLKIMWELIYFQRINKIKINLLN